MYFIKNIACLWGIGKFFKVLYDSFLPIPWFFISTHLSYHLFIFFLRFYLTFRLFYFEPRLYSFIFRMREYASLINMYVQYFLNKPYWKSKECKARHDERGTLLLIRGLPGAGKTALAEELGLPYCEADQFFEEYNDGIFNSDLLAEAHAYCFNSALAHLENDESVIVSNTSTREKEVTSYEELAEEYGARFMSIVVENRHGSSPIHDLPQMTVKRMRQRFSVHL